MKKTQTADQNTVTAALLDTPEAAMYLGNLQPTTLEQWRWNGKGPKFIKLNRAVRYRRSDLDEFIERRIFGSTTEAQQTL